MTTCEIIDGFVACGDDDRAGRTLQCAASDCKVTWFHPHCVGETMRTNPHWFCPKCTQKMGSHSRGSRNRVSGGTSAAVHVRVAPTRALAIPVPVPLPTTTPAPAPAPGPTTSIITLAREVLRLKNKVDALELKLAQTCAQMITSTNTINTQSDTKKNAMVKKGKKEKAATEAVEEKSTQVDVGMKETETPKKMKKDKKRPADEEARVEDTPKADQKCKKKKNSKDKKHKTEGYLRHSNLSTHLHM